MKRRALMLLAAAIFIAAGCGSTGPSQGQQQPRMRPNSNENPDTDPR